MTEVYLPGLIIGTSRWIRKVRRIPRSSEVLVRPGDPVDEDSVLAYVYPRGYLCMMDGCQQLDVPPDLVPECLVKRVGDPVRKGEVIARRRYLLTMVECRSPVDGILEQVSAVTGRIAIRTHPVPVRAGLPGVVAEVEPGDCVVVECFGDIVQGMFGLGGEVYGRVQVVAAPDEVVTAHLLGPRCRGGVLVGGSLFTADALEAAARWGARAVITGGANKLDIEEVLLHRQIGVGVTGHEDVAFTLVLTEGFGRIPMSERAHSVLRAAQGCQALVCGATQIRAGVVRPEVIIPRPRAEGAAQRQTDPIPRTAVSLRVGDRVRVVSPRWYGRCGVVEKLPRGLREVATGSWVRIAEVRLDDGTVVSVPRNNLEMIPG